MQFKGRRLSSRWIVLALLSFSLASCGGGGSDDVTRVRNNGISNRISAGEDAAEERRRAARQADGETRRFTNDAFTGTNANGNNPGSQTPEGRSARPYSPINLRGSTFNGTGGGSWQSTLLPLGLIGVQAAISGLSQLFGGEPIDGAPQVRGSGGNDASGDNAPGTDDQQDPPAGETPPGDQAENAGAETPGEQTGGRSISVDSSNADAGSTPEADEVETGDSGAAADAESIEDILEVDEEDEAPLADASAEADEPESDEAQSEDDTEEPQADVGTEVNYSLSPAALEELLSSDGIVWVDCSNKDASASEQELNDVFENAQSGS